MPRTEILETAEITVSRAIQKLLNEKPAVVNVGLKKFTKAITENGGRVVQYDWRPVAGGNERMRKIIKLYFVNQRIYCKLQERILEMNTGGIKCTDHIKR